MTHRNCEVCSTPMVSPKKQIICPWNGLVPWSVYKDNAAKADITEMITDNLRSVCPQCLEEVVEHLLDLPEEDFEPMFAHYEECLSNC